MDLKNYINLVKNHNYKGKIGLVKKQINFFFNTKLNKTISTFIVNENLLRIHDYRVLKKRIRKNFRLRLIRMELIW